MTRTELVNPLDPAVKADPYPIYAHLRASAPVHPITMPDGSRTWLITRYDDADQALRDPRLLKARRLLDFSDEMMPLVRHMLNADPPDHTRLRTLVHKAFAPRLVSGLRPRIQHIADELLDAVAPAEAMDLISDYAFPLPIIVITELLGVPSADRDRFREWSNIFISNAHSQTELSSARAAMIAFIGYLRALLEDRRAHPRNDLISALAAAEEQGDALSEDELLSMIFLLIVAGHETTVNLIGNGMLALLTHPDQLRGLIEDPSLLPSAVEELLRYDGPVETSTLRFASADVELNGVTIPEGDRVLVILASANRDEGRFAGADQLDITRANNRHLAFGKGIHFCLGAPLARLEGQIAIGTLLRRLPALRPAIPLDQIEWRPGMLIRGLRSFPVAF
ncbi:MAG: cytochrome P450 family protein [Egibacteraceae bacterium]